MNQSFLHNEKDGDTRFLIKQKFLELYSKKILPKMKVTDLISKCNISRGTFYFYFTDIMSLYRECEKDLLDKMGGELDDVILATVQADPHVFVNAYMGHLEYLSQIRSQIKIFLSGSEEATFRRNLTTRIYESYGRAVKIFKNIPDNKKTYYIQFYSSGICQLLCDWILADCTTPARILAEINSEILFSGSYPQQSKDSP